MRTFKFVPERKVIVDISALTDEEVSSLENLLIYLGSYNDNVFEVLRVEDVDFDSLKMDDPEQKFLFDILLEARKKNYTHLQFDLER